MSWQPDPQGVQEVLAVLRSATSTDNNVQRDLSLKLDQLRTLPEFIAYLVHILIVCVTEEDSYRATAGLLLKNLITTRSDAQSPQAYLYVKSAILQGLQDKEQMIRQTAGAIITSIINGEEPSGWPEALDYLTKGMQSQDENVVEGTFYTLEKICEDCPQKLDFEIQGKSLLEHLVPQFILATKSNSSKVRLHSLQILQALNGLRLPAMSANIDAYLQCLFARATDDNPDVRKAVCAALGTILSTRPDKLVPELKNVVDYMAYCTKSSDELVALEACEFWLTFAEDQALRDQLAPYLHKIAPLLLEGMVYSEMDLLELDRDDEDEAVPDRESDIKPKFYSGKTHSHEQNDPTASNGNKLSREAGDKALDDDEESDFDYDEEDEDFAAEWNLRKCSAAALDVMAVSYGENLLEILLPYLKERLFSEDWTHRESGILALGAIAEGCINGLQPHLPQLVPWLVGSLQDKKALVRSITCWTLGRYASWCVQVPLSERGKYFLPSMEGLLKMTLDPNKKVQEAGCSAFATFEEEAGSELVPYLEPILRNLTFAFKKYQQKNLLILYDALGTLADSVGTALGNERYLNILMPPLIERWQQLGDNDGDLVPLLECLSSVSIAAGKAFAPFTGPVFERCLKIISTCLSQYQQYDQNPDEVEEPDRTFIVVALDLLSGLTQALGPDVHQLVTTSNPPLLHLTAMCLVHYEPPIRQSANALLGDMAITAFPLLKPVIPQIMPSVIDQIVAEPAADCVSVCNNAAWAAGEIALQFNGDAGAFEPFVPALVQRLVPILLNSKSPKSLSENAAVTIGRIGLTCPALVAPDLATFAQAWCTALWEIKDNEEKDSAFRGFCMMISANPPGIESSFIWFCNAVCKWQHPSSQLDQMFRQIIQGFKNHLGAAWEPTISPFPPVLKQRLSERYQV